MRAVSLLLLLLLATPAAAGEVPGLDPAIAAATVRIEIRIDNRVGDCTGVLVAPDVVATAAHCAQKEPATAFRFWVGGEVERAGLEFIARGATIARQIGNPSDRGKDWLLVRIAPVARQPLPLATTAEIEAARSTAAHVQVLSYAGKKLHTLGACGLLTLQLEGFFAMSCRVGDGDSGGPIVLTTSDGPRVIGLVYAQAKKASIGTAASQFAHLVHP